jgi:hypothetical protein
MLFYRAALPLSRQTLTFVSGLVRVHRREIGSPWRALNPGRQALLVLVYLRKGEPFTQVGAGFDVSTTTRWRYVNETVELLAVRAPKTAQGVAEGEAPWGEPAGHRVSGRQDLVGVRSTPGSTHDTAAARIWQILAALDEAGLIALGDKGYHGYDETSQRVITPYKGQEQARVPERRQPGPCPPPRPRRTRQRATQTVDRAPQVPQQSPPGRPTRQSHPRATELRGHRQMKNAHWSVLSAPVVGRSRNAIVEIRRLRLQTLMI